MREIDLQQQVADYIRLKYPSVIFHSDFGSGIKLTMGQAIKQKRLNGGRRSWPDMFLAEPYIPKAYCRELTEEERKEAEEKLGDLDGIACAKFLYSYYGLFIELKREGTRIFKKDGKLVADEHIREQFDMLHDLRQRGYAAEFACGYEEAVALIDDYMRGRYVHND
jgi:hypothetical protein